MARGTFALQVARWADATKEQADQVVRYLSLRMLQDVVYMSPVGNPDLWKDNAGQAYRRETHNLFVDAMNADAERTGGRRTRRASRKRLAQMFPNKTGKGYVGGRFRGNWQAGVNVRPNGQLNRIDPNGGATVADGSANLASAGAGDIIWLTNNLPYAVKLEYGHSTQAPGGMVRITVARFRSHLNAAIGQAKAGT